MKYFITGGAGFIGSHMVDALLQRGEEVTVFDNLTSGKLDYISHHRTNKHFEFIKGDVGDLNRIKKAVAGHDFIFHFASNPDIARGMLETDLDLREGIILTYNILEAMRLNSIKKIIYSSGSGVYGETGIIPAAENYGPLLPISMYGASKMACEGLISAFCHLFDMQAWIFRFANIVGKRQTHGVGFDFIRRLRKDSTQLKILGDGKQSKSYIHVDDVISAMLFVLKRAGNRVNVFNVATDDYITVSEIAQIVVKEMGLENVKFVYTGGDRGWKGDVPFVRFDLSKIHSHRWKAKLSSIGAIRKSVQEMLKDI
jgi:UDP-glucose 4-epimerase